MNLSKVLYFVAEGFQDENGHLLSINLSKGLYALNVHQTCSLGYFYFVPNNIVYQFCILNISTTFGIHSKYFIKVIKAPSLSGN